MERHTNRLSTSFMIGLLCFLVMPASAKVIFVSTLGDDANDGQSWNCAMRSVQAGLDAAAPGDQAWVAAGTYVENITLALDVQLYGGFAGNEDPATFNLADRDITTNETILDGNQAGSVVIAPQDATETTRIDGFTVRNGLASSGGGINCSNSSPTIANNRITGNSSSGRSNRGGGIAVRSSFARITNNTIIGNSAISGGGISCHRGSPTITNNTLVSNSAGRGGGISCSESSPMIVNTIVAFNTAGIYATGPGALTLRHNCVFGNPAYDYEGVTDPTGIDGNISVDPKLADAAYGNVHIQPGSPCVDAGDNDNAYGESDMDGQPRIQPAAGVVDIGADESNGTDWSEGPYVIVRVAPEGNDSNDGLSWAQAKRTVQAGIDVASQLGGEVWIRTGIYDERIALSPYAYVYGGFVGTEKVRDERDWDTYHSILDGQAAGSVVTVLAGFKVSAIDGFTIRNGIGSTPSSVDSTRYGGGIYCYSSSPTIANNTIIANSANRGAGIFFSGATSSPVIKNNTIAENNSYFTLGSGAEGGGISCGGGSPIIVNNRIRANSTEGGGGGIYCSGSFPTIANNTISANTAVSGGGISCSNSSVTVANNMIAANSASEHGAGIDCWYSSVLSIVNTTMTANVAPNGSALTCDTGWQSRFSTVTISNSIIWNGIDWLSNDDSSIIAINYSNIEGGWPGTGNIDADPLFVSVPDPGPDGQWGTEDDDYGDLRLQAGSPCIDAGDNAAVPPDMADLDGDGDTDEPTPFDLSGMPRFIDDPETPDTGAGTPPIVDMGAYEFVPPNPADFNGDGVVGADDLAILAACFTGPAIPYDPQALPPGCALAPDDQGRIPADLDQDGDVDQSDFARFQRLITDTSTPPDPGQPD